MSHRPGFKNIFLCGPKQGVTLFCTVMLLLLLLLLYYNTANTGLGLGPRGLWQSLEAVGTGGGVSASSRRSGTRCASSMAFTSGTGWLHWGWTKLSFQVPPDPHLVGFCDSEAIWCCCWVSGTPGQGGSGVCLWRGRVNEQGMCPLCLNPSLGGVTPQGHPDSSHQGTSSARSQLPGSPVEAGDRSAHMCRLPAQSMGAVPAGEQLH